MEKISMINIRNHPWQIFKALSYEEIKKTLGFLMHLAYPGYKGGSSLYCYSQRGVHPHGVGQVYQGHHHWDCPKQWRILS